MLRRWGRVKQAPLPKSYLFVKQWWIQIRERYTSGVCHSVGDTLDYRLIIPLDLQVLQWWTEAFLNAILQSTRKMPYSMRYLAREMSLSLRVSTSTLYLVGRVTLICTQDKFPGFPEEVYGACVGRLVFYRYINPALLWVHWIEPLLSRWMIPFLSGLPKCSTLFQRVSTRLPQRRISLKLLKCLARSQVAQNLVTTSRATFRSMTSSGMPLGSWRAGLCRVCLLFPGATY